MKEKIHSNWIDMPGGRLHVLSASTAGEAVVLLSGAGIDNACLSWKRLLPVLASRYRVFAIDWPKQGESRPWRGVADHASLLECVDAVFAHFDLGQAHLIGLSQGGAIALDYAITRPSRVGRLVAVAPAGIIEFPPGLHQLLWLTAKMSWFTAGLSTLLFRKRSMAEHLVRKGLFAGPSPDLDEVVDAVHQEILRNGAGASDWQNASIGLWKMKVNLLPDLHRISCPTLLIQGDRDVAVRPQQAARAARLIPGAQLVVLKDHGHWPNRQSPKLFNDLILRFLEDRLSPDTQNAAPE